MKLVLSVLLTTTMSMSLHANIETNYSDLEPFDRSYQDIKNEIISEDFFKNEKRNLMINNIRNQCHNNDTNIGMITCLSDLADDMSSQINLSKKKYMDAKFNKSYVAWQSYVIAQCQSIASIADGGSLGPKLYAECLTNLYQDYLNVINTMY